MVMPVAQISAADSAKLQELARRISLKIQAAEKEIKALKEGVNDLVQALPATTFHNAAKDMLQSPNHKVDPNKDARTPGNN